MKTRLFSLISLVAAVSVILLLAGAPLAQAERQIPAPVNPAPVSVGAETVTYKVYLPFIAKSCGTGQTYGTVNMVPPVADHPDYLHGDLNLYLRGYRTTSATPLGLKGITGPTDTQGTPPQLATLFSPNRIPTFTQNYQIGDWAWCGSGGACPDGSNPGTFTTNPIVTLAGFQVTNGEKIYTPYTSRAISPSYNYAVLYAAPNQITIMNTAQDTVASGYAIHIDKICVDPSLQALYTSMNAAGRDYLPALSVGQAIGNAIGTEIVVAIVDTGTFQDPRSCKDWWRSYNTPANCPP